MSSSVFIIRIQDKQSETAWKVHAEYRGDSTGEKNDIFEFSAEDFRHLNTLSTKDYGIYLGKALFQNDLREFFKSAFHSSQKLMKVTLSIDVEDSSNSDNLRALHWERLCVPMDQSWQYLPLEQRLPFSHHVSTANLDRKYSPIQKDNLKALVLVASPENLETEYNLASFDIEVTVAGIRSAFGDIPCDILANHIEDAIGLPTLKKLIECLTNTNPPYTILHIISHGSVDQRGNTWLYWSNEANQVEPILGGDLIERLCIVQNLPHLIFLCSCSSANYCGGLAQGLIQTLATPTVVAMTDSVTIKTATELAHNFYPRLLKSGEVDVALQQAAAPLAERHDITIPGLFSSRINPVLFGIQEDIIGKKSDALQIFVAASRLADGRIKLTPPQPKKTTEPYKFLSYYETTDTDIFFGRTAISEHLVAQIVSHKLVLINGKSGSGKTSIINAGIIPRLIERGYFILVFREYDRYPTEDIKKSLAELNINLVNSNTLLQCIRSTIKRTRKPVAIFFDQFERFFLKISHENRKEFVGELKECLESVCTIPVVKQNGISQERKDNWDKINIQDINLVISLREDFFGRLGEFWKDIPDFNTESYSEYLEPLNEIEAREAIAKPLGQMEWKVGYEPEFLTHCLVPNLLQGSEGESNKQIEPVHLQIVCNRLFKEVRKCYIEQLEAGEIVMIKQKLYEDLGGVEGILQGYLQEILNEKFSVRQQQDEVKTILKQMVTSQGTREFRMVIEIAENLSIKKEKVEEIIQQLDRSRLIETISGEDSSQKKYSITHEFLAKQINQWYTLKELELKRATEIYERCLENWNDPKNRSCIPRNQFLFLQKYKTALLKWKPEGKQLFHRSKLLYYGRDILIGSVSVILVGVTGLALIGQRNAIINQIEISRQASEIAISSNEDLEALITALRAAKALNHLILKILPPKFQQKNKVRGVLHQVVYGIKENNRFKGHQGEIQSVNFNSDGTRLVTVGKDGFVILWNLKGEQLAKFQAHSSSMSKYSVSFSPNNQYIVTEVSTGVSNLIRLWDLEGNQLGEEFAIKLINPFYYGSSSVSFNSNGEKIVVLGTDGTAHLRNSRGELLKKLKVQNNDIINVTFSPDGSKIATVAATVGDTVAISYTVQLWDNQGNFIDQFQAPRDNYISAIAFSPNSQRIATGGNFTTHLWDLQGNELNKLKNDTFRPNASSGGVSKIIFSPNGQKLATLEVRGRAYTGFIVWDLEYDHNYGRQFFEGSKLIFHPDGEQFLIDGRLLSPYSEPENRFISSQNQVKDFAFSPNGKLLVTTEFDNVRLWNFSNRVIAQKLAVDENEQIIVSPDSNLWAKRQEGKIFLSNRSGKHIAELIGDIPGENEENLFSPNGDIIATQHERKIMFWDVKGNQLGEIQVGEVSRFQFSLTLSPNNELVATEKDSDSHVIVWDIAGNQLGTLPARSKRDTKVMFSRNGEWIVTDSDDGIVKLWDRKGNFVAKLEENCRWCSFFESPDSKILAVADRGEESTSFWNWEGKQLDHIEGSIQFFTPDYYAVTHAGRAINEEEKMYLFNLSKLLISSSIKLAKTNTFDSVQNIYQSPNKELLFIQEVNGKIHVWNLLNHELTQFKENGSLVGISRENKILISVPGAEKTNIFDTSGNKLAELKGNISKVIFNENASQIVAFHPRDEINRLWDLEGNLLAEFKYIGSPLIFNSVQNLLVTSKGVWQIDNLDQLMKRGCDWLHDYLKYSQSSDRHLCDGIPPPQQP